MPRYPAPPDLIPASIIEAEYGIPRRTINSAARSRRLRPAIEMPGKTGARLYRREDVIRFHAEWAKTEQVAS